MILVLSHKRFEAGTDPVLSWLLYDRVPFIKVTLQDLVDRRVDYIIDVANQDVFINGLSVKHHVDVIWHRRFINDMQRVAGQINDGINPQLQTEIKFEIQELVNCLSSIFADKSWLTPINHSSVSKLAMLHQAQRQGLRVPASRVLTTRAAVTEFLSHSPTGLISKPLSDGRSHYMHQGDTYLVFTNRITPASLADLPDRFFPSLFQECIKAQYELRVFYLDGRCFTTAILNHTPTRNIDRKIDSVSSATHYVPYQLPVAVESAIDRFMRANCLNTGSIDMMVNVEGEYVFIEVNPVGQFMAESVRTNANIDRAIAAWLTTTMQNEYSRSINAV